MEKEKDFLTTNQIQEEILAKAPEIIKKGGWPIEQLAVLWVAKQQDALPRGWTGQPNLINLNSYNATGSDFLSYDGDISITISIVNLYPKNIR